MNALRSWRWWFAALAGGVTASASAAPEATPGFAARLVRERTTGDTGRITQLAWGPDGRLYASRNGGGAVSFAYDPATGAISDPVVAAPTVNGIGIAWHAGRGELYLGGFSQLWRLRDGNHNHQWGESGETRVAIVTGLPAAWHSLDQFQLQGNTLFVGIGIRGIDGRTAPESPFPDGESALGGTISWIEDVSLVPDATDAARTLAGTDAVSVQTDATAYTSTDPAKLRVHSAGARNPFGLALDANGRLFFTNNFSRAETDGAGRGVPLGWNDEMGSDFARQVHDQFFAATAGADYGYPNDNWRGGRDPAVIAPMLDPASPAYRRGRSITPDNLFATDANSLQLHEPGHPVGLGPSASADGFAFWNAITLPTGLRGAAFIARYVDTVAEASPGTRALAYADLVAVDPSTGEASRVAEGFVNPLAVLVDPAGRLLVADYGAQSIHTFASIAGSGADDAVSVLWRERFFGHPFAESADSSQATDDPDGDGADNLAESIAGTDPRAAGSVFRIRAVAREGDDFAVRFPTVDRRRYQLERSPDLAAGSWQSVGGPIEGRGLVAELRDGAIFAAGAGRCFYRVRVVRE